MAQTKKEVVKPTESKEPIVKMLKFGEPILVGTDRSPLQSVRSEMYKIKLLPNGWAEVSGKDGKTLVPSTNILYAMLA